MQYGIVRLSGSGATVGLTCPSFVTSVSAAGAAPAAAARPHCLHNLDAWRRGHGLQLCAGHCHVRPGRPPATAAILVSILHSGTNLQCTPLSQSFQSDSCCWKIPDEGVSDLHKLWQIRCTQVCGGHQDGDGLAVVRAGHAGGRARRLGRVVLAAVPNRPHPHPRQVRIPQDFQVLRLQHDSNQITAWWVGMHPAERVFCPSRGSAIRSAIRSAIEDLQPDLQSSSCHMQAAECIPCM